MIHLDIHFWRAGWQETPREEWEPKVRALAEGERWIIDGNFGGTMEIRLERADTIVFLDFPRYRYLWRAQKRVLQYRNRQRPDLAEGCAERFDREFTRWLWHFPKKTRPAILARIEKYRGGRRVVVLRRPAEVRRFLESEVRK